MTKEEIAKALEKVEADREAVRKMRTELEEERDMWLGCWQRSFGTSDPCRNEYMENYIDTAGKAKFLDTEIKRIGDAACDIKLGKPPYTEDVKGEEQ